MHDLREDTILKSNVQVSCKVNCSYSSALNNVRLISIMESNVVEFEVSL